MLSAQHSTKWLKPGVQLHTNTRDQGPIYQPEADTWTESKLSSQKQEWRCWPSWVFYKLLVPWDVRGMSVGKRGGADFRSNT